MSTYTQLHLRIVLKKETPPELLNYMRLLIEGDYVAAAGLKDSVCMLDPVFSHDRFTSLFSDMSHWGHPNPSYGITPGGYPVIEIHSEMNQALDLSKDFAYYISKHAASRKKFKYLGYYKVENCEYRINLYNQHSQG